MPLLWDDKDPDSDKDYGVDWSDWLTSGDSIATSAWAVTEGDGNLTLHSEANTTTEATVWLQDGTAGVLYSLRNRITTAQGRVNDQTVQVRVREN